MQTNVLTVTNYADKIKGQLRDSGVKGAVVSAGWRAERDERIKELRETADSVRKKRALRRLEAEISNGTSEVVDRVAQFNELYGSDD